MKTYTRRRPLPLKIEDVLHKCRLCLEISDPAVPIFTEETTEICPLALRIMVCIGLEVAKDESLPSSICAACLSEIEKYYVFKKKCVSSYQKLKSHLEASKKKDRVNGTQDEEINILNTTKCEELTDLIIDCEQQGTSEKKDNTSLLPVISSGTDPLDKSLLRVEPMDENSGQLVMQIVENKDLTKYEEDNEHLILQVAESTVDETPCKSELKCEDAKQNTEMKTEPTHLDLDMNEYMTDYLTNILTELGIISEASGFVTLNHQIKTVELETKDGVVTLELAEEEDVSNVGVTNYFPTIMKRKRAATKTKKKKVKRDPTKPTVFRCAECSKTFASSGILQRHARSHRADRPHRCQQCGRGFTQKEVRDRHELIHSAVRPFQCRLCEKSFTQRAGLRQHARVHGPPQPLRLHPCLYCHKIFLHQSGLSRHMTSHKGVKHTCPSCRKEFTDKSSLQRHIKTHSHQVP